MIENKIFLRPRSKEKGESSPTQCLLHILLWALKPGKGWITRSTTRGFVLVSQLRDSVFLFFSFLSDSMILTSCISPAFWYIGWSGGIGEKR